MGVADRDDMTAEGRQASNGAARWPEIDAVTTWIIVGCIAAYIIDRLLRVRGFRYFVQVIDHAGDVDRSITYDFAPLSYWGHFSALTAVLDLQVWRFITYQFLHANLDHLIFNMVALYFFGPMVESYLTSRQYGVYYLLCGVGGAILYVLMLLAHWQIGSMGVPLIGASAGIFGVLIAATLIAPRAEALVLGVLPIPLRTLAWLFIAYAVFTVLFRGGNAGGEAAHLGGAAMGWVLMRYPWIVERIAWFGKRAPPF